MGNVTVRRAVLRDVGGIINILNGPEAPLRNGPGVVTYPQISDEVREGRITIAETSLSGQLIGVVRDGQITVDPYFTDRNELTEHLQRLSRTA